MLFITRKIGETIKIGEDVTIVVAKNKPGFADDIVTLGIDAPKNIHIKRGELEDEKENGTAAGRGTKKTD